MFPTTERGNRRSSDCSAFSSVLEEGDKGDLSAANMAHFLTQRARGHIQQDEANRADQRRQ
jgi:hypothetical protein